MVACCLARTDSTDSTAGSGGTVDAAGATGCAVPAAVVSRDRHVRDDVGDSADGFPGVKGWGKKAASSVLSRYIHIENIPTDWTRWNASIRGAKTLAESLQASMTDALLFRVLATLRSDVPVFDSVDELLWRGPR